MKHEWVQCYQAASLYAFQPANIASRFRHAGLILFLPNTIYQPFFLTSDHDKSNLECNMKVLLLSDALLEGVQLHKTDIALKRVLSTQQLLTSLVKCYVECLADTFECLLAQLAIA